MVYCGDGTHVTRLSQWCITIYPAHFLSIYRDSLIQSELSISITLATLR